MYGAGDFWRYQSRPRGLGFIVATAAPVAAATGPLAPVTFGLMALASALPFVGQIGAGRKEADVIVPEQEKLGVLLGDVDRVLTTYTLTASDLRALDSQLRGTWQTFLTFIYQETFTADGDTRASDQARATMEPQVNGRLQAIAQMLGQLLGRVEPAQALQVGSGYPQLHEVAHITVSIDGYPKCFCRSIQKRFFQALQ